MRPGLMVVLISLILVGCEAQSPPEPAVVYASGTDETILPNWFAEFTSETGIPVIVKYGQSGANTDFVIDHKGSPPADVLLTTNVADIWRAAEKGALRPIQAASMSLVPNTLKDPDRLWAALDVRYAAIDVASSVVVAKASTYADLANEDLRGQLCLSSSQLSVNRSLIAMLIEDMGRKPAERIVRGWIQNLAVSPFATEGELRVAMQSGACRYGILSRPREIDADATLGERLLYVDIDGVGIARHAQNPQAAQTLVNWMLEEVALTELAWSNGRNIGIAGWRDEDARLLAERAGYH